MSRWLGDFRDMEVGASYIPAAFTDTKVTLYWYIATALLRLRRFPWRIVSRSSRFVRWPAVHAVLAVATIIFVKNPSISHAHGADSSVQPEPRDQPPPTKSSGSATITGSLL